MERGVDETGKLLLAGAESSQIAKMAVDKFYF